MPHVLPHQHKLQKKKKKNLKVMICLRLISLITNEIEEIVDELEVLTEKFWH